jgi:hypothetical protein
MYVIVNLDYIGARTPTVWVDPRKVLYDIHQRFAQAGLYQQSPSVIKDADLYELQVRHLNKLIYPFVFAKVPEELEQDELAMPRLSILHVRLRSLT